MGRAWRATSSILSTVILFVLLVFAADPSIRGATFDWRAYPGNGNLAAGNYVTPVRNQGSAGTCWAFSAVGAVEANYDITFHLTNSTLDLSEQHLVCDGSAGDAIYGGWEDLALNFVRDHGIVNEATLPYTASDYSPNWPLHPPYTLYRITSDGYTSAAPTSLKTYLQTYGPVTAAIDANSDFIWPSNRSHDATGETAVPQGITFDAHGNPNDLNHAIVITGFTDDSTIAGGGYWHIKNSWGAGWGDSGYGYISYATMQADDYITGINGVSYTVTPISGDANGDGAVNVNDLSVVLTNYNKAGMTWSQGDFNGDGTVDVSDLSKVLTNYNKTAGLSAAGTAPVPEPGAVAMLAVGLLGLLVYAGLSSFPPQ
jgi:hypothetical protein